MNKRGSIAVSILLGVILASLLGLTTDQILNNVFISSTNALRVTAAGGSFVTPAGNVNDIQIKASATALGAYTGANCAPTEAIQDLSSAGAPSCVTLASGTVGGTGTTGLIPNWSASTTLADSLAYRISVTNDTVTGTTVNKLAKFTSAGQAIITSAAETAGVLGIIHSGAGTSGSAIVTTLGAASCVSDNATTAGHYATVSASTAGSCSDTGAATFPVAGTQVIGIWTETGVAGTRTMFFNTPDVASASSGGGGGGAKNPGGAAGDVQYRATGNNFAAEAAFNYDASTNTLIVGTLNLTTDLTVANGGTGLSAGTSGGVPYFNSTTTMASSALLASNGIMIGGGAGAAPQTDASLTWDVTNNRLSATSLTSAADGTARMESHTGAFNSSPSAGQDGFYHSCTGGGSASFGQNCFVVQMLAGYTGSSNTWGSYIDNLSAGTGNNFQLGSSTDPSANYGFRASSISSGSGLSIGGFGQGSANGPAVGFYGRSTGTGADQYGVIGNAANSTALNVGGMFSLGAGLLTADADDTALAADNGAIAASIFRAYDNGTVTFIIADGGAVSTTTTFKSTAANDLGWTVQNAANQACNTTCTTGACVIGIDTITTGFLACTDATSDSCLCAG